MNEDLLNRVCGELSAVLTARRLGAIFPVSRFETVFDFRLESGSFLFVSIEPANPRLYLIKRKMKEIARSSLPLTPFFSTVRKSLTGAEVVDVSKLRNERALIITFAPRSEVGSLSESGLVIQVTGRSANLFLIDDNRRIIASARPSDAEGQRPGDIYLLPARPAAVTPGRESVEAVPGSSISEYLDIRYREQEKQRAFERSANAARQKLDREIAKRKRLIGQLKDDLQEHGDAEKWKRFGDLLLANSSTAVVSGRTVRVRDFFSDDVPEIEIEINENESPTEAAERYYKRYTKARNAAVEVARRLADVNDEIGQLEDRRAALESAIAAGDGSIFEQPKPARAGNEKSNAGEAAFPGARRFISSDGIEILVGKKASDNDRLTFRVARSLDFWLHAADYPGSHVIVRNPNRQPDIPQKTLLESAQLAAFYSNARSQPKAAVNYTQKKFVSKPKGGAPGLARLAKFKTILVEPQVPPGVGKLE